QTQANDGAIAKQAPPVRAPAGVQWGEAALDVPTLTDADGRVFGRRIPEPAKPCERPHEAERPEHDEELTPREAGHEQGGDQRWRQPAGEVRAHEERALRPAPLLQRKPARERARHVWKRPRLA